MTKVIKIETKRRKAEEIIEPMLSDRNRSCERKYWLIFCGRFIGRQKINVLHSPLAFRFRISDNVSMF